MTVNANTIWYLKEVYPLAKVIVVDGNDDWRFYDVNLWDTSTTVKRISLLQDSNSNEYLAIEPMAHHFTGEGKQALFTYAGDYWDNVTSMVISAGMPQIISNG